MSKENPVSHYDFGGISPLEVFKVWSENDTEMTPLEAFYRFNALKYLWRFYRKNGSEDLDKAADYIRLLKKEYEGKNKS